MRDLGASWIEVDEPALVFDLSDKDIILFKEIYTKILDNKGSVKILLQTYFGDIRDCYQTVLNLDFDGIGLDFIEGKENLTLLDRYGFDQNKILFAGVVNGKNIWKNEYEKTVSLIEKIKNNVNKIVLNTSCSLIHVPYTIENELSPTTVELINCYSQSVCYLAGVSGSDKCYGMTLGRDIGMMIHGKLFHDFLQYKVAVMNGQGLNTKDKNSPCRKDCRNLHAGLSSFPASPDCLTLMLNGCILHISG